MMLAFKNILKKKVVGSLIKLPFLVSLLISFALFSAKGQTTYTVGASETFASISAAVSAINTGGGVGSIGGGAILVLYPDYLQSSETIGFVTGASALHPVIIRPSATLLQSNTAWTLSGSYITIDGRVGGTGSTQAFILANTSTTGVTLTVTGTNNTIQYVNIEGENNSGSSSAATAGVVVFGASTGNTISYCNIHNITGAYPTIGIYSVSASTNTVSNNNIYNYFNASVQNAGIYLGAGATGWTISGNSFYDTTNANGGGNERTFPSNSPAVSAIYISNTSGNGFTISGNYIGGTGSSCATPNELLGAHGTRQNNGPIFSGIFLNVGTTTTSSIEGNTIQGITVSSGYAGALGSITATSMIAIQAGLVNVGDITGNTLSSQTVAGSFIYYWENSNGIGTTNFLAALISDASSASLIENNTIGGITTNQTSTGAPSCQQAVYGIYVDGTRTGAVTISGNTIGSTTLAKSILNNSLIGTTYKSLNTTGIRTGVTLSGSVVTTISNNTIANLYGANIVNNVCSGIDLSGSGYYTVSGNLIYNLTGGAPNVATTQWIDCGIETEGLQSTAAHNLIYGNTIHDISNFNTSGAPVAGINICGNTGTSGNGATVYDNLIYNLSLSGVTNSSFPIAGIRLSVYSGATPSTTNIIYNNMIMLGYNASGAITGDFMFKGIDEELATTTTAIYNTVYLGGTVSSGTQNTFAYYCNSTASGSRLIEDNIFDNARTGGTGVHYAIELLNTTNTTVNYNDYISASGNVGAWGATPTVETTLSNWVSADGQDANSKNITPTFVSTAYNSPNLALTSANSTIEAGTAVSAITTITNLDFYGNTRESTPYMGAYEYLAPTSTTWNGNAGDGLWATSGNWSNSVPTSTMSAIIPASISTYPTLTASTTAYQLTVASGATVTITGSAVVLTVNNNLSNSGTITGTGSVTVNNDYGLANNGTISTAGVTLAGSLPQTISGTGTISYLTLNSSSGASVASGTSQTISNGLTLTSGILTLAGTLTVSGGATITMSGGGFSGTPAYGTGVNVTYTVTAITGKELTPSSGSLTLTINASGYTVTLGSAATVTGLALTAGTLADGGYILTNSGNITGTGTHTGSGKISMTGSGATISGAILQNLTLNNAGGFSLTGNATINGTLTMTSGKLTLGSYNFTLGSTAISGYSSSNYIVVGGTGNLIATTTSSTAYTFPLGTSADYTPLTLTPTTGSATIISVNNTMPAGTGFSNPVIARTWSINPASATGSTVVTLGYNSGDAGTDCTPANPMTLYSSTNGTSWSAPTGSTSVTPSGTGPYTYTSPSLTSGFASGTTIYMALDNTADYAYETVNSSAANWATNSASVWYGGSAPGSGNDAIVATNNVTVAASTSITNLTINAGATLTVASGMTLTVTGNLINNGTISGSGTVSVAGSSTQTISGTGTISNLSISNTSGGVTIANQTVSTLLTLNTGTLTLNSAITVASITFNGSSATTVLLNDNGYTLICTGNIYGEGQHNSTGAGEIKMTGAGSNISENAGTGHLHLGNVEIAIGSGNTVTTNTSGSGALLYIQGNLTITSGTLGLGGGNGSYQTGLVCGANGTSGSPAVLTIASGATLNTVSGGNEWLQFQGYVVINNSGTLGQSSYTANTGPNLQMRGASSLTINNVTGSAICNIYAIGCAGGTNASTSITINQSLTLSNTNNSYANEALSLEQNTIAGTGSLTITLGTVVTVKGGFFHMSTNSADSTLVQSTNTYNINGTLDVSTGSIGLYTTSNTTVGASGTTNTLTVNIGTSGVLKCGSYVRINNFQPSTQTIAVNVTAGGTISYSGSSYTTTAATTSSAVNNSLLIATYCNLGFTGSSTITGAAITVNGTLTLGGILTLGTGNLTLASTTISGASSSNYIVPSSANIIWSSVASGATTFPIGTASSYTPLTINPAATTQLTLGVSSTVSPSPSISTEIVVLQWSVLASPATTATVTYQFNAGNEASSFVVGSSCELGTYNGSAYSVSYPFTNSNLPQGSGPYTLTTSSAISIPSSGTNNYVIGNTGSISGGASYTWTGATNTSWNTASNWNSGAVPTYTVNVEIPSGTTNALVIAATDNVSVNNLVIDNSVTVANNNSSGVGINVYGTLANNGTISGNGTLSLVGSSSQAISGIGSVNNLTLNNSYGAVVSNGASQTVSSALTLTSGTLTLTGTLSVSGSVVMAGGTFSGTPSYGSTIPVTYTVSATTGSELAPSSGSASLVVNASSFTVTLGSAATVVGVTLTAGTLADGGYTLTNTGNLGGTSTHTGSGEIKMTATSLITGAVTLGTLEIAPGSGNTVTISTAPAMIANLKLTNGTLANGGKEIKVSGNVTGTGIESGTGRINLSYLTSQVATASSGSTSITLSAANSSIVVGQYVSGPGIATNTTVQTYSGGTSLTLSTNTTLAISSKTLYFSNSSCTLGTSSSTVTVSNIAKSSASPVTLAGNVVVSGDLALLPTAYGSTHVSTNLISLNGNILGIGGNTINYTGQQVNINGSGKLSMIGTATSSGVVLMGTVGAGSTTGFAVGDTVTFSGGTYGIAGKGTVSSLSGSTVTGITIIDAGSGYTVIPTGFVKYSGSGSGTGSLTSPIIATSTATKYINVGNYILYNNLELASTASNNTVVVGSTSLGVQSALTFATAAQTVLGTSGGNTNGTLSLTTTGGQLILGGSNSNPNTATAATITMGSNNYINCGSSSSPLGTVFINSNTTVGTMRFNQSASYNYLYALTYYVANTGALTLGNPVTITNSLTMPASANLVVASGANLTLPSTVSVTSTGAIDATNSNATVTIVTANTLASGTFASSSVGNLVITNAAPTLNQAITVSTSLTLNTTNTSNYTFTNGSNLTIGSGASVTKNRTGTGNLYLGTVPAFSSLSATNFNYTGSVLDTIGNEMPAALNTIGSLTINNSGGVTMKGYDITTSGALTLTAGKFIVGNNNITAGTLTTGSSSSYVKITGTGTLIITASNGTAQLYPVGTADGYAPITLTPNTSVAYTIGLQTGYTYQPGDTLEVLKLQWSVIGSTASTASATYQFSTADFSSAYTVSASELGNYRTGYTTYTATEVGTPSGSSPYTLSTTGLSIPTSGYNYYVIGDSNNVAVTSTQWTGTHNTDWGNNLNWTNNVPTYLVAASIPVVSNLPVITSSQAVGSLTIASGVTITNNDTLTIAGTSFTNNGTIAGTGTTILAGSGAQSIGGSGLVGSLILDNSAGATVATNGSLGITGLLTLQSGTLTTNGNLTLKSSSTNTASLAPISGTVVDGDSIVFDTDVSDTYYNYGSINGNVTVERYIPAKTARRYSFIGSPVSESIRNSWQQQIYITGSGAGGTPCGSTTGDGGSTDKYNSNGFDVTQTNTPSMYNYNATKINGSRYVSVSNTDHTNLSPGTGYVLNIRGNRNSGTVTCANQLETATPTAPEAVTLSATGTLVMGNLTVSVYDTTLSKYTLLANPYPSPISYTAFQDSNSSNTYNKMWTFSPMGNGNYTTYSNGVIANGATGYDNTHGDYIASGQAFFVQATPAGSNGTVTFHEIHKTTGTPPNTNYFGIDNLLLIRLGLYSADTTEKLDEIVVRFNDKGSNAYNPAWDAESFSAESQTLTTSKGSNALAIDTRSTNDLPDTIAVVAKSSAVGTFILNATEITGFDSLNNIILKDNFLGKTQDLINNPVYSFNITSDTASSSHNRFQLLVNGPIGLPVNFVDISATLNKDVVNVKWSVTKETDISSYSIERSVDGNTFTSVGNIKATGNNSYSYQDKQLPAASILYYRIKAVSEVGTVNYSNIAKLAINNSPLTTYSLYPNPLIERTLNVQLMNVAAGKYVVSIYNSLGQKVNEQAISHQGGNASHAITINNALADGIYGVVIREEGSGQLVYQANLSVQK